MRSQGDRSWGDRHSRQPNPLCLRPAMIARTRGEDPCSQPCHTTVGAVDTALAVTTGVTLTAKRKGERRRGGKTYTVRQADSDGPLPSSKQRSAGAHQNRDAAEAAASSPLPGAYAAAPPAPGTLPTQVQSHMFSAPVLTPALATAGIPITNDGWLDLFHVLLARSRMAHTVPQDIPAATAEGFQAHTMPRAPTTPASAQVYNTGLGVAAPQAGRQFVADFPAFVNKLAGLPLTSEDSDSVPIPGPLAPARQQATTDVGDPSSAEEVQGADITGIHTGSSRYAYDVRWVDDFVAFRLHLLPRPLWTRLPGCPAPQHRLPGTRKGRCSFRCRPQ